MYTLKKAIAVKKTAGARWGSVSIGSVPVYQLFSLYRKMYITLGNTFLDYDVTIDMEILRLRYSNVTSTFSEFLVSLGDSALTPTIVPPVIKPKYAVYRDAFRTGYNVKPVLKTVADTAQIPEADKVDLKLIKTSPVTDMEVFYKNCLVSVNGYYHSTDFNGSSVFINDGAKTMRKSKQNQIGITSFLPIGNITNIRITEDMIYKQASNSQLSKRIYVKTGAVTAGKSIFLILGGYLILPETGSFWQTNDDTFAIDLSKMPFLQRVFESQQTLDLSSLGLDISTTDPTAINIEQLMSDEVLTKYLTLSQTFFCVIDAETIFTNRIPIRSAGTPGMMIAYSEPNYPLIVGHGRVAEYWHVEEDGQWAVNMADSYRHNRVFMTVPGSDLGVINSNDTPEEFARSSQGYLLEIGKDF